MKTPSEKIKSQTESAFKGPDNPVLAAKRLYREEDQKKIQKAANPFLFGALALILIAHLVYLFAQQGAS